ncbi:unnamed protein product [Dracunculus medinensis]|uniref:Apple domain-containing protein n=1 Tax=Dracunculus medinensis TaxID=318479 RepID=A0A3P7Q930_DRAME|nr:unnamed protein product [Dracunculus medinensis]
MCYLGHQCNSQYLTTYTRSEGYTSDEEARTVFEGITLSQCADRCKAFSECQSFDYDSSSLLCELKTKSAEPLGSSKLLYTNRATTAFFQKLCLTTSFRCPSPFLFERFPQHILVGNAFEVIVNISLTECLSFCLKKNLVFYLRSVMFFYQTHECILNHDSRIISPHLFSNETTGKIVDYFDNICFDGFVQKNAIDGEKFPCKVFAFSDKSMKCHLTSESSSLLLATTNISRLNQAENEFSFYEKICLEDNFYYTSTKVNQIENDRWRIGKNAKIMCQWRKGIRIFGITVCPFTGIESECGLEKISISSHFPKSTSGAIFIKDHFDTCRLEFYQETVAKLEITMPTLRLNNPPCPGREIAPFVWSFVVVVQVNNLGIPELITTNDRVFNISCDFSRIFFENDQLRIKEFSGNIAHDQIRLAILRNGKPVSTVLMGEELEMRWTMLGDKKEHVGFFINNCTAERLDGLSPHPTLLTLIANGCIMEKVKKTLMPYPLIKTDDGYSTVMRIFRFDGSRRVRIRCSIDICAHQCSPVDFFIFLERGERLEQKAITGTLTIVDAEEDKRQLIQQITKKRLLKLRNTNRKITFI